METEIQKNKSGGKKYFLILTIILSAFLIYYSVMSMLGPSRKLSEINNQFATEQNENNGLDENILSDSAYLKLLKERAYLQAKVVMAKTDSIYLTLNLKDSTVNIEISGVVVHSSKISSYRASSILEKGDQNTILSMLASPFTIARTYATIRQEPLMIKMAPKDTSEYIPDIIPDTSITKPVNFILITTNGNRIYFYQEENNKASDKLSQFIFDLKFRLHDTLSDLKSVVLGRVPDYYPFIKIKIPRADAKIIYRALPKNGQMAVFI